MVTKTEQDGRIATVMEQMPYGLYIVGSRSADGQLNGMMADWVMQVSFEPRLVAISFELDSQTLENIRATDAFSVSLLPEDDAGMRLAAKFAQPYNGAKVAGRSARGSTAVHHKLDTAPHWLLANGCPVLTQALGWFECEAEAFVPAGDHTLVIGRVTGGESLQTGNPLTSSFMGWTYSG
jgi:flavin reductase (DIM6/NTAB) family NADH-FMN oxidoreductase RutF